MAVREGSSPADSPYESIRTAGEDFSPALIVQAVLDGCNNVLHRMPGTEISLWLFLMITQLLYGPVQGSCFGVSGPKSVIVMWLT